MVGFNIVGLPATVNVCVCTDDASGIFYRLPF